MSLFSCSNYEGGISATNQKLVIQAKENSKKAVDLYLNIKKNFESKTTSRSNSTDLTQEQIDEFLVESGLQAGDVSLETVTTMIGYLNENLDLTFNERVDAMSFSNFVKTKLIEMNNNGVIENLPSQAGFQNLTQTEKEMLLNANYTLQEFANRVQNIPCPGEPCTAGLILLGYGIGNALCPVCGVVGAVIGLIIGISIKP
jgi:proline dehydrogenase